MDRGRQRLPKISCSGEEMQLMHMSASSRQENAAALQPTNYAANCSRTGIETAVPPGTCTRDIKDSSQYCNSKLRSTSAAFQCSEITLCTLGNSSSAGMQTAVAPGMCISGIEDASQCCNSTLRSNNPAIQQSEIPRQEITRKKINSKTSTEMSEDRANLKASNAIIQEMMDAKASSELILERLNTIASTELAKGSARQHTDTSPKIDASTRTVIEADCISNDDDAMKCRYCFGGPSGWVFKRALISPCWCSGSLAYVHRSCLERWLTIRKHSSCDLCKYHFVTKRIYKSMKEVSSNLVFRKVINCSRLKLSFIFIFAILYFF